MTADADFVIKRKRKGQKTKKRSVKNILIRLTLFVVVVLILMMAGSKIHTLNEQQKKADTFIRDEHPNPQEDASGQE